MDKLDGITLIYRYDNSLVDKMDEQRTRFSKRAGEMMVVGDAGLEIPLDAYRAL